MTSDEDALQVAKHLREEAKETLSKPLHWPSIEAADHIERLVTENSSLRKSLEKVLSERESYLNELDEKHKSAIHFRQESERLRKALQGVDKSNSWGEADDIIREALSPIEEKE